MSLTLNALRKLQQTGAFPTREDSTEDHAAPKSADAQNPGEEGRTGAAAEGDPPTEPVRLEQEPPVTTETEHTPTESLPNPNPWDEEKSPTTTDESADESATQALQSQSLPRARTERFDTEPVAADASSSTNEVSGEIETHHGDAEDVNRTHATQPIGKVAAGYATESLDPPSGTAGDTIDVEQLSASEGAPDPDGQKSKDAESAATRSMEQRSSSAEAVDVDGPPSGTDDAHQTAFRTEALQPFGQDAAPSDDTSKTQPPADPNLPATAKTENFDPYPRDDKQPEKTQDLSLDGGTSGGRQADEPQPAFAALEPTSLLSDDPVADLESTSLDLLDEFVDAEKIDSAGATDTVVGAQAIEEPQDIATASQDIAKESSDLLANSPPLELGHTVSLDHINSTESLEGVSPTAEKSESSDSEPVANEMSSSASSNIESLESSIRHDKNDKPSPSGAESGPTNTGKDKDVVKASPAAFDPTQTHQIRVARKPVDDVTNQTYRDFYDPIIPALDDRDLGDGDDGKQIDDEPAQTSSRAGEDPIVAELADPIGDSSKSAARPAFQVQTSNSPREDTSTREASSQSVRSSESVIPTGYERELIQNLSDQDYEQQFAQLRDRIYARAGQRPSKYLLVSPSPTERTADVVAHLAIMLERDERDVLIVDANLEKQTLTRRFEALNQPGLCDALTEDQPAADIVLPTSMNRMRFVPSGDDVTGISRVPDRIQANVIRHVLQQWTNVPRTIICDVGAIDASLSLPLAEAFDAVVMVVSMQDLNLDRVRDASKMLEERRVHMLGCVVTDD